MRSFCVPLAVLLLSMPPQRQHVLYCTEANQDLAFRVHEGEAPGASAGAMLQWRNVIGTVGRSAGDVAVAALRWMGFYVDVNGSLGVQQVSFAHQLLQITNERQILAQQQFELQRREQEALAFKAAADAAANERVRVAQAQLDEQERQLRGAIAQLEELKKVKHTRDVEFHHLKDSLKRSVAALPATHDRLALDAQHNVSALFTPSAPDHPTADTQRHLLPLLRDQAKCRVNTSGSCRWSAEVMDMCVSVALSSRSAYESLRASLVMALPHIDTVLRHAAVTKSTSGHSAELYESVRVAAAALPEPQREVALIFDEVSLVGELMFKVVRGEYRFFGMVDRHDLSPLFSAGRLATEEESAALRSGLATHALVFQVAELTGAQRPRFRRVVGIHAVASLTADMLDTLFWETVGYLAEDCGLQVVAAVCDGAGCNRLWMKMQAMGATARGTPNAFVKGMEWVYNRWGPPGSKIFLISDPAHLGKKSRNGFYSSCALAPPQTLATPCNQ